MLCHNLLIGKNDTCTYMCTVRTYNVMSQLYVRTPTSPTLSHSLWRLEAHLFLDTHPTGVPGVPPRRRLSDPGVLQRGPSPQDVALRGVMQALVRIQAYMLADIVVAVRAVDLAIEAVV